MTQHTRHTPGPWSCTTGLVPRVFSADKKSVCGVHKNRSQSEIEANARLIVAAPEMLEGLEEAFDELTTLLFDNAKARTMSEAEKEVENNPTVIMLRALIAKAKGG